MSILYNLGGVVVMIISATMVIYTEKWLSTFGRIPFFEKYLGTEGGSRLGYKLIGIALFFLGTLALVGLLDNFVLWVLSPILAPLTRGRGL